MDSLGLLLKVLVTEANGSERVAAAMALAELDEEVSELMVVWVDQGYQGSRFAQAVAQLCGATVEVVKRSTKGFEVLPKRWKVERTFGWLNRQRRLSKDYELLPEVSETMIYASMIRLMLPRLTA